MIASSDIAFLCLPDDAAREVVSRLDDVDTKILDTSTAHRTNEKFAYGFPELSKEHRDKIKNAKFTAVPGCHASGFISIVYPLVKNGIISPDYPISCYSLTGYSGGGKKMIAEYQDEERDVELLSPRQYALSQTHKHLPEMKVISGLDFEPTFSPIVADFYCGMTTTVPIHTRLLNKKYSVKNIIDMFKEQYKNLKTIKVYEEEVVGFIGTNNLADNDGMEIMISGNDDRILISSRFDNLGKGSSGAAVQCMNLMLGVDETKGLML